MGDSRRSRNRNLYLSISLVTLSIAAFTYLYSKNSKPRGDDRLLRKRKKILICGTDEAELIDLIPHDAKDQDELYVLLLRKSDGTGKLQQVDIKLQGLVDRTSMILQCETISGITHITRHLAPDLLILATSLLSLRLPSGDKIPDGAISQSITNSTLMVDQPIDIRSAIQQILQDTRTWIRKIVVVGSQWEKRDGNVSWILGKEVEYLRGLGGRVHGRQSIWLRSIQ